MNDIRISYGEMEDKFLQILTNNGFTKTKAAICARIFAENSLDGIYTHGINRFPRFVEYVKRGFIHADSEPAPVHAAGALEQWDGRLGPGPVNAIFCTNRAMKLAKEHGIGCVAIANTNHWMRGGNYGWQAAKSGFAFIGWTNTEANMPAWGAKDSRLGNNPLVLALPYNNEAIVLDFAITQYSYGKMEAAILEGLSLSFPGGFNLKGNLTQKPEEIMESKRALPIGYWKGAGLSLLLDIFATVLSSGLSTHELSKKEAEYSVSQVFIAFCLEKLSNSSTIEKTVHAIITDFKKSAVEHPDSDIRFPGERVLYTRKQNLNEGIPVKKIIWEKILNLYNIKLE
jgi:3-dehydro-L-gulonate 2-dehydrogenase